MKHSQKGFTLVEIAIVLVIIGLLLGGILKGQEMIVSGQVRNVIDQGEAVTASVFAFQDRFRAIPGDYSQAGNNIPNAKSCSSASCGNGHIDQDDERGLTWQQLAQSGFLAGTYSGAPTPASWSCQDSTCPVNAFGGTMLLNTGNEAAGTAIIRGELYSGQNIPITVVAEIDRKIDDGNPMTGQFQVSGTHQGVCENGGVYNIANNPDATCGAIYRNF